MRVSKYSNLKFKEFNEFFIKLKNGNRFNRLGKCFSTEENKYFYDSGTGKVFQINDNLYKVLDCLWKTDEFNKLFEIGLSDRDLIDSLTQIKDSVENENILLLPNVETMKCNKLDDKEIQIKKISFEMTERCNLRCKYCIYQEGQGGFRKFGGKDITFELMKKTIDLLAKSTEKVVNISFYGGEPLLRFDLIKQCISYCEDTLVDKEVYYNMTTNCTLMTDEMAEYISSIKNFFTTVSLDGPKFIHDANRIDINGEGSFDKTIQGLKKLVTSEDENASERISFNIVLSDKSKEKLEIIQEFFYNFSYIPKNSNINISYVSTGHNEHNYLGIDTDEEKNLDLSSNILIDWSFKNINHNPNNLLISKEYFDKQMLLIHKRIILDEPVKVHYMNGCCVPGDRKLYVTVDGNFAVCEKMGPSPFIGDTEIGLDFDKIKRYYIDDFTKEASKFCNECWAVTMCNMCYTDCYNESGINISYRHRSCSLKRKALERSLVVYHSILENNPDALSHLNNIEFA